MELLARLAGKIVNNLVHSGVIKEEDAEIYIYGGKTADKTISLWTLKSVYQNNFSFTGVAKFKNFHKETSFQIPIYRAD